MNTATAGRPEFMSDVDSVIDDLHGEFPSSPDGLSEDFVFDSSETTEEDLKSEGFVELEGFYHFEITKVELHLGLLTDEGKENTPHILIYSKVLQGVPGQSPAGTIHSHRIWVGGKGGGEAKAGSIDAMYRFGIGCGLLKYQNIEGKVVPVLAKTGQPKVPLSAWRDAVGLQFLANIKKEVNRNQKANPAQSPAQGEGETNYGPKFVIPMGRCYRPDDPNYAHVPKNAAAMAAIGLTPPQPAQAVGRSTSRAAAKTSTPANAPAGKMSDPASHASSAALPPAVGAAQVSSGFNIDDY
jgi:hypothetical protein